MTAWDIAIIGGGVAGSTAAALLAQRGLQVILIEKGRFPRQKVCGEFLSPEGRCPEPPGGVATDRGTPSATN